MQAIYDSPWHNPAFFYVTGAIFLIVLARKLPFLLAFLVIFSVELLADVTVTGGWSPAAGSAALQPLAIAFVVLGDYRFFVLVERHLGGRRGARPWLTALGFSVIVPVLAPLVARLHPSSDSRVVFLTYELLFFVLALVVLATLGRRARAASAPVRRWLRELVLFEVVQYALWALADITILSGVTAGYLLRLVPNCLYYACFLPFVLWRAPAEVRA